MLPINNKIHSEKTVGVANRLVEEWAKWIGGDKNKAEIRFLCTASFL